LRINSTIDELSPLIIKIINEEKPPNLNKLINLTKEKLPVSEEEILSVILKLQSQGKIKLNNPLLPDSLRLSAYIKTGRASWFWATILIAALTVVTVFTVPEETYPWSYIRNALGIIFVLWLPGYTCIKALFPAAVPVKTSSENMDSIERAALSLGMSLALTPIAGLILYYTPFGIRLVPTTLSLLAMTLVFATAALYREFHSKSELVSSMLEIPSQN
jgi:hypothetical protein